MLDNGHGLPTVVFHLLWEFNSNSNTKEGRIIFNMYEQDEATIY